MSDWISDAMWCYKRSCMARPEPQEERSVRHLRSSLPTRGVAYLLRRVGRRRGWSSEARLSGWRCSGVLRGPPSAAPPPLRPYGSSGSLSRSGGSTKTTTIPLEITSGDRGMKIFHEGKRIEIYKIIKEFTWTAQ